ncbi:hypothetical protein T265_08075 [Opisthorchis viverrini]|uniref:Uncharacterized protein n=1 Tax=Opisthorchis viverrini TaxID=6198 RepID=A0A074ZF27_OPIVI|nr:hypothetical protein T265_08075 [Opisthorchis viverrini]KER24232.1 hypothetical protein T265_08075 [Opisthorchis viverrini]
MKGVGAVVSDVEHGARSAMLQTTRKTMLETSALPTGQDRLARSGRYRLIIVAVVVALYPSPTGSKTEKSTVSSSGKSHE